VHQLTALSGKLSARDMRHTERSFAATMTNRLRTEATDHLLAAGHAVGARRFVAQSFAAFRFARTGGPGADRGRSPRSQPAGGAAGSAGGDPPSGAGGDDNRVGRGSRVALRRLLRSGDRDQLGSGCGDGGADPQASVPNRRRRWWRLVARSHRRRPGGDAAAVENGEPGIYNIVDDEPAPVREWLPVLASALMPSHQGVSRPGWRGSWSVRRQRS
jgi:2-alkyl-3-oxoalkanoate reductase